MTAQRTGLRRVRSTVGFTIGVIVVAIVLTAILGHEAWQVDRKHRETANLVLRDYARSSAFQFLDRILYDLTFVPRAFGTVAGLRLDRRGALPSVQRIIASADTLAQCPTAAGEAQRFYFRLDLRDGSVAIEGPRPSPAVLRLLADSIGHRLRSTSPETWYIAPMFRAADPEPRALIYVAVQDQADAPIAAFGFETCNSALWEQVFRGAARAPLLPPALARGLPNDSLLTIDATAVGQFTGHYRSPVEYPGVYTAEIFENDESFSHHHPKELETRGSIRVQVAVRPDMAAQFVIGGLPRSRLPMLAFLLVLTGCVLVLAIRQLARERELLRLRADFTSSVSHELRTPLSEILLFAETLEMDRAKDPAARREAVQIIVQEARHLAQIVDNVLQFSRAERRMLRLKPERTVLGESIRESAASFTPLAASYGVNVRLELDDRIVVLVHRGALHQMLLNLLDNAVKYGPPGQCIIVRTSIQDGAARLVIDDEGPGIQPVDRGRIWEPFIRASPASSGITGSGIGLAVVRELVHAHQGRCWVGESPAGGARFVIELPGAMVEAAAAVSAGEGIA